MNDRHGRRIIEKLTKMLFETAEKILSQRTFSETFEKSRSISFVLSLGS